MHNLRNGLYLRLGAFPQKNLAQLDKHIFSLTITTEGYMQFKPH